MQVTKFTVYCTGSIGVGTNFNVGVLWWTGCDHAERSGAWSPLGGSRGMKIVLDHLIAPFRGSWSLDFTGVQRTKCGHASVVSKKVRWSLMLVAQNSSLRIRLDPLIAPKKNVGHLIPFWSHNILADCVRRTQSTPDAIRSDTGRKRFYRRCVCNYP